MHTAYPPSVVVNYPSMGAVVSQQLTSKELALPGFISISRPSEGPGFLGMNYAPFTVQNPGQPPTNIQTPTGVDEYRIRRRQQLFYAVEDSFSSGLAPQMRKEERAKNSDAAQAHTDIYGKAFKLVADKAGKKVFDLNTESPGLRKEYGQAGNFGQACLLARKLVETGVTCVEVDLGGWDNQESSTLWAEICCSARQGHGHAHQGLVDRSLYKNTSWSGWEIRPRRHQSERRPIWARSWSVVVGGGGIKGGQVYGATSADGTDIKDKPCSVGDLFATLYKGIGIDPALQVRDPIGRPHNISGKDGKPIADLVG